MTASARVANTLLAALPRTQYRRIAPALQTVQLEFGAVLYEPGDPIAFVYFPNDALVSLLTVVDQRSALEVGMVGYEGLVGVALAMGVRVSPVRALVQGAGTALRLEAAAFRAELDRHQILERQTLMYIHALMFQIAQTAACNRFHLIEARLARWLLMTRDRVRSDEFHLTHEFLGHMLGVRRVGVTGAANGLKQRGLIGYARGDIAILDGPGLEMASCSCYATTHGP